MRLVIFDIDGTLVDSQTNILEAQVRAFTSHGLRPPSPRAALSVVGRSLAEAFTVLVGADGPVEGLSQAYKDAWTAMRGEPGFCERLYPGAGDIIAELRSSPAIRLGVATGKSRGGVDRLIAAQGWAGAFATIQTADDHPSKPHPSMILTALAETGVAAGGAVMVGDTTFDMAMAVAAGVRALGVSWGYHDAADLLTSGAEAVARDFEELRSRLSLPKLERRDL